MKGFSGLFLTFKLSFIFVAIQNSSLCGSLAPWSILFFMYLRTYCVWWGVGRAAGSVPFEVLVCPRLERVKTADLWPGHMGWKALGTVGGSGLLSGPGQAVGRGCRGGGQPGIRDPCLLPAPSSGGEFPQRPLGKDGGLGVAAWGLMRVSGICSCLGRCQQAAQLVKTVSLSAGLRGPFRCWHALWAWPRAPGTNSFPLPPPPPGRLPLLPGRGLSPLHLVCGRRLRSCSVNMVRASQL